MESSHLLISQKKMFWWKLHKKEHSLLLSSFHILHSVCPVSLKSKVKRLMFFLRKVSSRISSPLLLLVLIIIFCNSPAKSFIIGQKNHQIFSLPLSLRLRSGCKMLSSESSSPSSVIRIIDSHVHVWSDGAMPFAYSGKKLSKWPILSLIHCQVDSQLKNKALS